MKTLKQKLEDFFSKIYHDQDNNQIVLIPVKSLKYLAQRMQNDIFLGQKRIKNDFLEFPLSNYILSYISTVHQIILFMDKKKDKEAIALIVNIEVEKLVGALNKLFTVLYDEVIPDEVCEELKKSFTLSIFISFNADAVAKTSRDIDLLFLYFRHKSLFRAYQRNLTHSYAMGNMLYEAKRMYPQINDDVVKKTKSGFKQLNNQIIQDYRTTSQITTASLQAMILTYVSFIAFTAMILDNLLTQAGLVTVFSLLEIMALFFVNREPTKEIKDIFSNTLRIHNQHAGNSYTADELNKIISYATRNEKVYLSIKLKRDAMKRGVFKEYRLSELEQKITQYRPQTSLNIPVIQVKYDEKDPSNNIANFIYACKQEKRGKAIKTKKRKEDNDASVNNTNPQNDNNTNNNNVKPSKLPINYSSLELSAPQKKSGLLVWDDSGSSAFFQFGKDISEKEAKVENNASEKQKSVRQVMTETFLDDDNVKRTHIIENGFGRAKGQFGIFKYMKSCGLYELKIFDGHRAVFEEERQRMEVKDLSSPKPKSIPVWKPIGIYRK